ncbi:flagellar basal body-associated FliL family protein [Geotalea uraniireducens]|uniref:Flagellar protein FliL n=1 Tax=Geotalea uraniireducens (strain Rf4) TaxID=351605 RepID=A5G978_GEOUR|nr:flagellar basal body-associated FliL family protein [Geotalea uraniireducens]ABQ28346.1 flagellar basal body-associated protein FliL [Geotalea uraniireducens Rf4]
MAEQVKDENTHNDKNKLIIIVGGVILAVVVIAVAVLLMSKDGKAEKVAKAPEAKSEKKGEGGEKGTSSTVYPLDPFIVNIYDGQEIRYLKIKVEFEMAGPEVKPEIDARQSALRDAILVLLTTKTMREVQDLQGKNQLRDEILATTGKILSVGRVTKVYFTDFVVQ